MNNNSHPWYHCILIEDGTFTPGTRGRNVWEEQGLPERVDGLSVLDIGSAEGYFAFESERRGASRIVAVDQWTGVPDMGTGQDFIAVCWDHFMQVHSRLGSKVVPVTSSVYMLDLHELFDVVIFSQVLYHLEHPLLGLSKVRAHSAGKCYFETLIQSEDGHAPLMLLNRAPMAVNDPSTVWIPNRACVFAMIELTGFSVETEVFNNPVPEGRRLCLILK